MSLGDGVFSLKRKGDFHLQFTRTLKKTGRYQVDLYLFTPHEGDFSAWTMTEKQFFFSSLSHRFGLMGLPDQDRASKADSSFALLSPHYEIMYGSWLFQYRASMDRLRQQIHSSGLATEPLKRALRLSQNFAARLRRSTPEQSNQHRYFRQMDIYFSWHAEQFFLECMTLEGFTELDEELKEAIRELLRQEYLHRQDQKYLSDLQGTPTRVWNRMSLYHRLLEYPVVLRAKLTELGPGTHKLVKAASTTLIMSLFTYFLFNVRAGNQQLPLTLLLTIALIYAVRDLLRDDMISAITRWLRKGKPRWKIRLFMPYTRKPMAQQRVWLDYRRQTELPRPVQEHSSKWITNEERQIICYRSQLTLDRTALEKDQLQERLSLDCEALCEMIQTTGNRLFVCEDPIDPNAAIEAHPIEKQHDYNLLLVYTGPGQTFPAAQRWRLRLGAQGIVQCESRKSLWPEPPEHQAPDWRQRLAALLGRG
ncbi:MAG: hypothetical protein WC247_06420 [Porticoccaceae bacterium]